MDILIVDFGGRRVAYSLYLQKAGNGHGHLLEPRLSLGRNVNLQCITKKMRVKLPSMQIVELQITSRYTYRYVDSTLPCQDRG